MAAKLDTMTLADWELEPLATGGTQAIDRARGRRFEYTFCSSMVRGVPHPPFIQPDLWELQKASLAFRAGDVFVCTMSKCGTTLAEQIVLLLLNGGDAAGLNPLHKNTLDRASGCVGKIWPEMAVIDGLTDGADEAATGTAKACMGEGKARMSVADFDALPAPRILKTHAPRPLFLAEVKSGEAGGLTEGVKVIYVTRNPFDACVSCYYHPKPGVSPASTGWPFDAFAKLWLSERVEFGGWANHVRGWHAERQRSPEQILWLSYEELVSAPPASIAKIAAFIGVEADAELVQRVADGSSFGNVKAAAQQALSSGRQGDLSHLRKGGVGDWRNHFSESLRADFDSELSRLLGGVDLAFDIGEHETWQTKPPPALATQPRDTHAEFPLVLSTGTAYGSHYSTQEMLTALLDQRKREGDAGFDAEFATRVFTKCGFDKHSVALDLKDIFRTFTRSEYLHHRQVNLSRLAEQAGTAALEQWGGPRSAITHLFWGTMTGGMQSPTMDIELVSRTLATRIEALSKPSSSTY